MSVPRYIVYVSSGELSYEVSETGQWADYDDVLYLENKIAKLEAQLKHNSDRDYNRGFEAGLCAGLNGG